MAHRQSAHSILITLMSTCSGHGPTTTYDSCQWMWTKRKCILHVSIFQNLSPTLQQLCRKRVTLADTCSLYLRLHHTTTAATTKQLSDEILLYDKCNSLPPQFATRPRYSTCREIRSIRSSPESTGGRIRQPFPTTIIRHRAIASHRVTYGARSST